MDCGQAAGWRFSASGVAAQAAQAGMIQCRRCLGRSFTGGCRGDISTSTASQANRRDSLCRAGDLQRVVAEALSLWPGRMAVAAHGVRGPGRVRAGRCHWTRGDGVCKELQHNE